MAFHTVNHDPAEIQKFDHDISVWWDRGGRFRPLHDINPYRLAFITEYVTLSQKTVLDVGCGGGILTEALCYQGAQVTGIDVSEQAIAAAISHAQTCELAIAYHCVPVEILHEQKKSFEIITCFELLEHVPDPKTLVQTCADLLAPGGWFFLSTLNRTLKSYLQAIIGAEYLLKLLPRQTHDYQKLIQPSELAAWLREAGFHIQALKGLSYHPFKKQYALTHDVSVNYLMAAQYIPSPA